MTVAYKTLQRQYAGLKCSLSLSLMLQLYMTCIPSVGSYGCELWGSLKMTADRKKERDGIEMDHMRWIRKMSGIRSTVPEFIVSSELQLFSLHEMWLERQFTFWNNLAAASPESLFRKVLLDACIGAMSHNVRNWVWSFYDSLQKLGYAVARNVENLQAMDIPCLKALFQDKHKAIFQDAHIDPRSAPSSGMMCCTYERWFSKPAWCRLDLVSLPVHISLLRFFLKFRTGSHDLPIVSGRFRGIPRSQRVCLACQSSSIGDEYHLVFECPALLEVRQTYAHLFIGHCTMQSFIWQQDIIDVMKFLRTCFQLLEI